MSQNTVDAIAEREKRTRATRGKAEKLPRRSTAKKVAKEAR